MITTDVFLQVSVCCKLCLAPRTFQFKTVVMFSNMYCAVGLFAKIFSAKFTLKRLFASVHPIMVNHVTMVFVCMFASFFWTSVTTIWIELFSDYLFKAINIRNNNYNNNIISSQYSDNDWCVSSGFGYFQTLPHILDILIWNGRHEFEYGLYSGTSQWNPFRIVCNENVFRRCARDNGESCG